MDGFSRSVVIREWMKLPWQNCILFSEEHSSADWHWHIQRLSEMRDVVFRHRLGEQLCVKCEWMETKMPLIRQRRRQLCVGKRCSSERISIQSPEKNADIRNVVFSLASRDMPDIHGVLHGVERVVDFFQWFPLPQVRC